MYACSEFIAAPCGCALTIFLSNASVRWRFNCSLQRQTRFEKRRGKNERRLYFNEENSNESHTHKLIWARSANAHQTSWCCTMQFILLNWVTFWDAATVSHEGDRGLQDYSFSIFRLTQPMRKMVWRSIVTVYVREITFAKNVAWKKCNSDVYHQLVQFGSINHNVITP